MRMMTLGEARNLALADAMREDPSVLMMGGIAGRPGMAITVPQRFADRTVDVPICELGAVGAALGASIVGMRPVVTVHIGSFLFQAWPQVVQEAANLAYQSGNQVSLPLVVHMEAGITGDSESRSAARGPKISRTIFDKPWGSQAAQHSQSPEGMLCSIPGLEVVCPSTPADAAGLLRSAIDSDNPTFFIEHRDLLFTKGQVGPPATRVPLGKAAIRQRGTDVLVIAHSVMTSRALEAAKRLRAKHQIRAEVLDLRSLAPLDKTTVLERVAAIGRVVLVEQGRRSFGVAAGIASIIVEEAFRELKEPIGFVCTADTPIPFSPSLLDAVTPSTETIMEQVIATLASSRSQAD